MKDRPPHTLIRLLTHDEKLQIFQWSKTLLLNGNALKKRTFLTEEGDQYRGPGIVQKQQQFSKYDWSPLGTYIEQHPHIGNEDCLLSFCMPESSEPQIFTEAKYRFMRAVVETAYKKHLCSPAQASTLLSHLPLNPVYTPPPATKAEQPSSQVHSVVKEEKTFTPGQFLRRFLFGAELSKQELLRKSRVARLQRLSLGIDSYQAIIAHPMPHYEPRKILGFLLSDDALPIELQEYLTMMPAALGLPPLPEGFWAKESHTKNDLARLAPVKAAMDRRQLDYKRHVVPRLEQFHAQHEFVQLGEPQDGLSP